MKSLRDQIEFLESINDLKRIKRKVDPHLEVGAIIRRSDEINAPVPFIESLTGYDNFRMIGALAALSSLPDAPFARINSTIGLPLNATGQKMIRCLVDNLKKKPVCPVIVDVERSPCKENILRGENATLRNFPVPLVHTDDAGKYVNTYGVFIIKSPDGSWCNWSVQRAQLKNNTEIMALIGGSQHINKIWSLWHELGKPMPFALVQGADPIVPYVASLPLIPEGYDDAGYAGSLVGRPLEMVKCETNELVVPASSEIVIEGEFSISRDGLEGPFGEFAGYYVGKPSMQPTGKITTISYRSNPIWPVVPEGKPVDEYHTITGLGRAAALLNCFEQSSLPVTMVWTTLHSAMHWTVIQVSDKWRTFFPGINSEMLCKIISDVLFSTRHAYKCPKVFIFDDDFDVTNEQELILAIATRIHPSKRKLVYKGDIFSLLTCYTKDEVSNGEGDKVVHNGLKEVDSPFIHPCSFDSYPLEVKERVIKNWVSDFR